MATIKDVAEFVAANNGISRKAAEYMLKDALSFIKDEVASGNEVNLDKFGKFISVDKAARVYRNPKDGSSVLVAAKKAVKFKAAADFKIKVEMP